MRSWINWRNWPAWIPIPNAWMSAILLVLLAWGITFAFGVITTLLGPIAIFLPLKLIVLLYYLGLLSPIAIIAVAYHWLHIVLDRFYPDTQSPEMAGTSGFFPGIMSWWEGLYGWLALALGLMATYVVKAIFSSHVNGLSNPLDWWMQFGGLFTMANAIRIVTAAYLYQFDYLVRDRLMSIGAAAAEANQE